VSGNTSINSEFYTANIASSNVRTRGTNFLIYEDLLPLLQLLKTHHLFLLRFF